ncbi:MAG: 4-hydroxythreonine-4-phosphate dehydrogenase PdxA [Pseudomonadota bacterium]
MNAKRPIALTMGDPSGIGPELTAKAWRNPENPHPFCLIGDPATLPEGVPVSIVDHLRDATGVFADALPVLPLRLPSPALPGTPLPGNAPVVVASIEKAVDLAIAGEAAAVVTNPINKKALYDGAGFGFPGHTEFLAELAGVTRSVMMLAGPSLKVVPVTIHIPLARVPAALTVAGIVDTIEIVDAALRRDFGIEAPRIAVAGLNPHAGEQGSMGREDLDVIVPAVSDLKGRGYDVRGPLPADTMFHARARATYDVAVTMYHDQGLIPIKTLDFDRGVNVTLGLPFLRTSPDHGTAYDIAGKGIADPSSLNAAIALASKMSARRNAA